ncbi:MAG: 3-oxoadipyl-CoA thiolase [Gammaproteobacteria bacterium]|nr:3-oxoadipyl-CoA thiolase [Gammaproteobacteria bacterium]
MIDAFICDPIRTAIGRYGGTLSSIRTDDLGAVPIRALIERNPGVDWQQVDDVIFGNANQAGECNRNIARMSALLAGLPVSAGGATINRLCGSGMDAVGTAARAIKSGEASLMIAGGVESMSRAPLVMPKATAAFSRNAEIYDTTIGWRFPNKLMTEMYGTESMPETAENLAEDFNISREDQDLFAFRSQQKTAMAQQNGAFDDEIIPLPIPQRKAEPIVFSIDEHARASTTLEVLTRLPTPFREGGSVTAGNASGINDGACAMIIASEQAANQNNLQPLARIIAMAVAGVEPRVMGFGPSPATRKVLALSGISLEQIDIIELNEAFSAQALAVTRDLGLADDTPQLNPYGGAIALGHPLGMSGARLVTTATRQLQNSGGRYALCTMCIGVGQGIAIIIERV